jgi:MFS family permease
MDRGALLPTPLAPRAAGQLREGLRYARSVAEIALPLAMMGLIGALAYEFQVSLPVMARQALHAGAEGYGFMTAAMGVGAIAGGLVVAARGRTGLRPATTAACAFAIALVLAALAPDMPVELLALGLVGAASVSFMSTGNSTLQLAAEPAMRGRVMALWFVALQGSTPIGGPAVGAIITLAGPRAGLFAGALACVAAVALVLVTRRRPSVSGRPVPETLISSSITGTVGPVMSLTDSVAMGADGSRDEGSAHGRDDRAAAMADTRGAGVEPARRRPRHEHPQRRAAPTVGAAAGGPGDDPGRARVDPQRLHARVRRAALHVGRAR